MTNTQSFAKSELELLSRLAKDPDNRPIIEPFANEILALCEKFGTSGQSGGSAPYTASAITQALSKLLLQEPICPVTGNDDEWSDVSRTGKELFYQNMRCSSLFKSEEKRPYYLYAITWKTQTGEGWSGSALLEIGIGVYQKITSRQYVKSFPFIPKTFVIDVTEKEVAKDDWEFHINDASQLTEVFEYYEQYND